MIIPQTAKHLDALLSWAAVQQAEFLGQEDPVSYQHDTGLAKHHVGNQWCFMASLLRYEWLGEPGQIHYIKRSRLQDYANAWDDGLFRKKPYFNGQSGRTKAGSYLQPIRWVAKISAFAVVEDLSRLRELLPWVTYIGKLSHKDFGAVRDFSIVDDPTALVAWAERSLPEKSPFATSHVPAVRALASPYWQREKFTVVAAFNGA